eukprot:jgi/Ulvmu1/2675/UM014_0131.1
MMRSHPIDVQETFHQRRHRWQAPPVLQPGEADLRKLLQLPEQYITADTRDAMYAEVTRQELERNASQKSIFVGVRRRQRSIGMAWGATITIEGKPTVIGNKFHDEVVAARAHDMAALLLSPTRSTKRINFAAWTYATDLMKYKFSTKATILAELRLLQTQMFDYSMFWSRGGDATERKSAQSDTGFQPIHTTPVHFSSRSSSSFQPEQMAPLAKQLLMPCRVAPGSTRTASAGACDLAHSPVPITSEADEVQALLRRDSSESGQSPMSAEYFGRCSRMSDRSMPRSRQAVSVDDRPAPLENRIHMPFHQHAPRRAMVRDAADRGRPRTSLLHQGYASRTSGLWETYRHDT